MDPSQPAKAQGIGRRSRPVRLQPVFSAPWPAYRRKWLPEIGSYLVSTYVSASRGEKISCSGTPPPVRVVSLLPGSQYQTEICTLRSLNRHSDTYCEGNHIGPRRRVQ